MGMRKMKDDPHAGWNLSHGPHEGTFNWGMRLVFGQFVEGEPRTGLFMADGLINIRELGKARKWNLHGGLVGLFTHGSIVSNNHACEVLSWCRTARWSRDRHGALNAVTLA